jgi:hypothetical protein
MTVVYTNPITYVNYTCTAVDGNIIAAPGVGYKLRIHHIYCVNEDDTDLEFLLRNGTGGSPYFAFYLAFYGGAVAQNLRHPWDLSENTALRYDYTAGTTPDAFITIGYEVVTI